MSGIILYTIAAIFLFFSFFKDRNKTKMALMKAWKTISNLLPQVIAIMIFVGISLALLSPAAISKLMGAESGFLGITIALIVGSVTLMPPFVSFPLAAALLKGGAGYPQIAAFISTLMAVGIVTLPTEIKYFNKSIAILRNGLAFVAAIIFTLIISQPIFLLIGLLDVWVPKETLIKFMGHNSGLKGITIAFILGSAAAGPLYAAFPIAAILLKKGARLAYVMFFLGVWSSTKLPLVLYETASLGLKFTLIHIAVSIPAFLLISFMIEKVTSQDSMNLIFQKAESL